MKDWPLVAQNRPLGTASSLGGSFERQEHYLSWPLKWFKFTGWKELEVLQGLFEQRPENPAGFSALRVSLRQGTSALLWEAFRPPKRRSPVGATKPSLSCNSFVWLAALTAFYKYDKMNRLNKRQKEQTCYFTGLAKYFFSEIVINRKKHSAFWYTLFYKRNNVCGKSQFLLLCQCIYFGKEASFQLDLLI